MKFILLAVACIVIFFIIKIVTVVAKSVLHKDR